MKRFFKRNIPFIVISGTLVFFLIRTEVAQIDRENSNLNQLKVFVKQNETNLKSCDIKTVILSAKLEQRYPWENDALCSKFSINHMIPHCRTVMALASYPGSGNTWMRYLVEGASGIFTGSRYKDLQIQMYGFWGEMREWNDGTTILQKTHDASKFHVQQDFGGRGILLLRNPYSAILSDHNYLFSGHYGRASSSNYFRKDWEQFVTIQTSRWLDMATNWTIHSDPSKVLVVHYENLKTDLKNEMTKILHHLGLPIDLNRMDCLVRHQMGYFHRDKGEEDVILPFQSHMRKDMDTLIEKVDAMLQSKGYDGLPVHNYEFYHQTDNEILETIKQKNLKRKNNSNNVDKDMTVDKSHGTKMVLNHYFKWLDSDKSNDLMNQEDAKTALMKLIFSKVRENSNTNTLTGLSDKAEGLLSKAVEIWPILQKPFQRDPIEDVISTDAFRGSHLSDLLKLL